MSKIDYSKLCQTRIAAHFATVLTLGILLVPPLPAETLDFFRLLAETSASDKIATNMISGATEEFAITVDSAALDRMPEALVFELPDSRRTVAERKTFTVKPRYVSWTGRVVKDGVDRGRVHFLDYGDQLAGTLVYDDERYQLFADGPGSHRLVRIEATHRSCALESDEWRRADETVGAEPDPYSRVEAAAAPPIPLSGLHNLSDPTQSTKMVMATLHVLGVYPSAMSFSQQQLLVSFVDMSIENANDVFLESNINARYVLSGLRELTGASQPPSNNQIGALDWMNSDPQELLDLRAEYAADMVVLFLPNNPDPLSFCGIANLPEKGKIRDYGGMDNINFEKRAFSVQHQGCGLLDYTFAHELGHNFGMRHRVAENTSASTHDEEHGRGHLLSFAPWQENTNGTLQTDVAGPFVVGYHFRPLVEGWVTAIGGFFNGTKTVKLWRRSGGLKWTPLSRPF